MSFFLLLFVVVSKLHSSAGTAIFGSHEEYQKNEWVKSRLLFILSQPWLIIVPNKLLLTSSLFCFWVYLKTFLSAYAINHFAAFLLRSSRSGWILTVSTELLITPFSKLRHRKSLKEKTNEEKKLRNAGGTWVFSYLLCVRFSHRKLVSSFVL